MLEEESAVTGQLTNAGIAISELSHQGVCMAQEGGSFKLGSWLKWQAVQVLSWLDLAVCPHNFEYEDKLTGNIIAVQRTQRFLHVRVNGREYVFDPLTGDLAGTGMTCT